MAASMSQSQKGSSSRRGGSMLQKIALKKEQLKLYPRMKKIERIGTNIACQVRIGPDKAVVNNVLKNSL